MDEQDWSPEPWGWNGERIQDANQTAIEAGPTGNICENDARRFVACVNACAGIPTESLSAMRVIITHDKTLGRFIAKDIILESPEEDIPTNP